MVSETSQMLRRVIGEDIQLVTKLSDAVDNSRLDPDQVTQVILNLAVNARDAMPEGGTLHIETANVDWMTPTPRRILRCSPAAT